MPVTIIWNTTGVWGVGTGVLEAGEVDANFYSVKLAMEALEADRPQPDNIASITTAANGTQWIVHLDSGTQIGPLPIPVLQFRDRGEWVAFGVYAALDVFTKTGQGLYSVLIPHTAAATFDEDAGDTTAIADAPDLVANRAYRIETIGTTDFTLIGAASNTVGLVFVATAAGTGTGTASPTLYNKLIGFTEIAGAAALDDLTDVTAPTPGDDDMLVFNGGSAQQWENRTPTEVTTILDEFDGTLKGLVPAPGSGMLGALLGADGIWFIPTLDDLDDVSVPSTPSDGQLLVWDSASSQAVFRDVAGVSNTFGGLTDVDLSGLVDGHSALYDAASGHWINGFPALDATGVTAGTYSLVSLTVGVDGRITAISSGSSSVNSAALDAAFGSTRGSILTRSASGWVILTPGTSGYFLKSQGAGADLMWDVSSLADDSVTNAKLANMPAHRFKGNNTGLTADPIDLTATELTAELNVFVGDSGSGGTKGLVPAPAAGDAAAGKFVNAAGGFSVPPGMRTWKEAAAAAASTALPNSPTYDNGTGGTGATLTAGANAALVVDGVTALANGYRILVTGQADATQNGIYEITDIGSVSTPWILTRATDFDGAALAAGAVQLGDTIQVYSGTAHGGSIWMFNDFSPAGTVTFGTSDINFAIVGGISVVIQPTTGGVNYDVPVWNSGSGRWENQRPGYPFAFSSPQTTAYTASQVIGHHRVAAAITIPANFASYLGLASQAGGTTNTTGSTVFSVEKAASASPNTFSQIGTITFGAAGVSPTFATSSGAAQNFAQGDVMRIVAPGTPDATFAGFYATIIAQRQ